MRWRTLAALVAVLVGACEALHPDMLVWTAASPTLKGYCAMSQGTPLFMLLSEACSCSGDVILSALCRGTN